MPRILQSRTLLSDIIDRPARISRTLFLMNPIGPHHAYLDVSSEGVRWRSSLRSAGSAEVAELVAFNAICGSVVWEGVTMHDDALPSAPLGIDAQGLQGGCFHPRQCCSFGQLRFLKLSLAGPAADECSAARILQFNSLISGMKTCNSSPNEGLMDTTSAAL